MLTIRELAKRFDDSEQTVRRTLRKLIQAGRLKPDADFRIENEDDVHHRVYFAVPSRFEDEAVEMSPKSGLGRKLKSLRQEPDIKSGDIKPGSDIKVISKPRAGRSTDSPAATEQADIKQSVPDIKQRGSDIKSPLSDIKTGDINEEDWRPTGFIAYVLKARDDLIEALKGANRELREENQWKRGQLKEKDRQIAAKDEQLKIAGASLLDAQRQIDAVTEDRDSWKQRALGLPHGTEEGRAGMVSVVDAEEDIETDHEEVQVLDAEEFTPVITEARVGSGLDLTAEQIVLELFEIYRIIEHAALNPVRGTRHRLELVLGRLEELSTGLRHEEWRGHAEALKVKATALVHAAITHGDAHGTKE